MKKIGLIAAAGVLAAAGTAFGQAQIDLRIADVEEVEAVFDSTTFTFSGPTFSEMNRNATGITIDPTGMTSFSIDLYVEASLNVANTGLITADTALSAGSGSFSAASIATWENDNDQMKVSPPALSNTDPSGISGLLAAYRGGIAANPGANGAGDTSDWSFLPVAALEPPVDITAGGTAYAAGEFFPVYKFTWSTDDLSARTITLSVDAVAGAYWDESNTPLPGANAPVNAGTFTITIVPAPGAAALLGLGGLVAIRRRR